MTSLDQNLRCVLGEEQTCPPDVEDESVGVCCHCDAGSAGQLLVRSRRLHRDLHVGTESWTGEDAPDRTSSSVFRKLSFSPGEYV